MRGFMRIRCGALSVILVSERTQSVIDALHAAAVGGSVQAASLYLQFIEKFTPKRRVLVDDDRETSGLSDLELADELLDQVSHLRVVGE